MSRHRIVYIVMAFAAIIGSMVALGTAVAGPADAATGTTGPWHIINAADDICLDGNSGQNGTRVLLEDCSPSAAIEEWYVHWHGLYFTVTNAATGKCLDGTAQTAFQNGSHVQLWTCNGNTVQDWYPVDESGGQYLLNGDSPKCLDGDLPGAPGSKVQLWGCSGVDAPIQRWQFFAAG